MFTDDNHIFRRFTDDNLIIRRFTDEKIFENLKKPMTVGVSSFVMPIKLCDNMNKLTHLTQYIYNC